MSFEYTELLSRGSSIYMEAVVPIFCESFTIVLLAYNAKMQMLHNCRKIWYHQIWEEALRVWSGPSYLLAGQLNDEKDEGKNILKFDAGSRFALISVSPDG